ncbi:MAG: gliding motility-associated C-terminal domain-containing protein, partial [Flavobacteriales bacterium]|nr:gliding motility-associated C-terminal domain-containing protein [Flavobacteriales bacterium]
VNEMFNPVLTGFDEMEYTLFIFNRWGQLVFESHDMSVGWDGSYSLKRNDNVQDGAYTWKVIAKIKNSAERKQFLGHVALLK